MIEKKVIVKNIEVTYKVFGENLSATQIKPMLILHGWGSSSVKWEKVAELLQGKIKIIVPDLPGFGQTPQSDSAWNLDMFVDWLAEFVQKVPELGGSFYLLGHSFGGALAAKFAIKYNQRVEKLFLISAACIRKNTFIKKILYRFSKMVKIFSFVPGYALFKKVFYKFVLRKSDYPYVFGVMQETYLRVISDDLSWHLPSLKVATIIIWGDKDDLTPIEQAHIINKRIPRSQLIILPGGVHGLQIKTPELLAEKIQENI